MGLMNGVRETRALTDSPSLTQSDPLIGASGMWPVYDLQLHGDILVTVSDDITVMDTRKRRIRSKLGKFPTGSLTLYGGCVFISCCWCSGT